MDEDVILAHEYSRNHKEKLCIDKKCGCFYCLEVFDPQQITEWLDEENGDPDGSALCPYCGIDSIIGESSGYPITREFLRDMNKYWFERSK